MAVFEYGRFEQPPKDENLLYYYCSMDTFASIIKSKSVWLRSLSEMNDPSELILHNVNFAQQIFLHYQKAPFNIKYIDSENEEAMKVLLYPAHCFFSWGANAIHNNLFFAMCMSSQENSLSQWRMYADNGKGVCLGFDKCKIQEYIKDTPDYQLQQIEYFQDVNVVIDEICANALAQIKALHDANDQSGLKDFMNTMLQQCMPEWSKYKVYDYAEEHEIRLVYNKSTKSVPANADNTSIEGEFLSDINWTVRNGKIDLHTELNINDLGLKTITLGPANNNSKGILNIMLAKEGIDIPNSNLYKSAIPYRG